MTKTKLVQLKSRTQECCHRPAAPPSDSLVNRATSVPPAATGSKEEHLDNLQAYNESLAETYIYIAYLKLLLLTQFKKETIVVSQ